MAPPHRSLEQELIGWIAACLLAGLLLPLMAMLYLDILETKNEVKQEVVKVERLRREIEKKERDKDE